MNQSSNRNSGVATLTMARDAARIVIGAVLAGAGFAILLALTVLSLTVISPPVHSSGLPSAESSASGPIALAIGDKAPQPDAGGFISEAIAAQPLPAEVTLANNQGAPDETLLGMPKAAAWALILALLAGALALVVRARSRT